MDKNLYDRSLDFIKRLAEVREVEYDLSLTQANAPLIQSLQAICAIPEDGTNSKAGDIREADQRQRLKDLCEAVLLASEFPVLQNWYQPEPPLKEYEYYERVFSLSDPALNLRDTKYVPMRSQETEVKFTVSADDQSVLRLQPNVQLRLWEENE